MKGMDIFCASPASTAICTSLDHRSMVRHGTRPIERSIPKPYIPCTSSDQLPFNPKTLYDKTRKSFANETDFHRKSSADIRDTTSLKPHDFHRKSLDDIRDLHSPPGSTRYLLTDRPYIDWISEPDQNVSTLVPTNQSTKPKNKTSSIDPSHARKSSSLALVSESDQVYNQRVNNRHSSSIGYSPAKKTYSSSIGYSQDNWIKESGYVSSLVPSNSISKLKRVSENDSPALKSSSSARSRDQVVVLRVSIHCKGCEGKVRKHISKMEGVTSFSIDLATKRVTVIGDVTPLGVLASISKVKNAQLWPSQTTTSTALDYPSPRWST